MTKFISNKRGVIGIMTAMVMGFVLVMVAVSLVLTGISSRINAFTLSQSENALISTEGCAEEGLIRLSRDPAYAGGSLTLGDSTCLLTVSDGGNTLVVKGVDGNITHNLLINLDRVPSFHVSEWSDG